MSEDVKKQEVPEEGTAQCLDIEVFEDALKTGVPANVSIRIPKAKTETLPLRDKIAKANGTTETFLTAELTKLYIQCELTRMRQQRPLLYWTIFFVGLLIVSFNAIIFCILFPVIRSFLGQGDNESLFAMFDFLKYYVGAVVVELIGLLVLIARSVFASHYGKVMEILLKPKDDGDQGDKEK